MAHLDLPALLLLAGAALLAGAVNAIAGGGTLISLPALLLLGLQPVAANLTNTLGLLAGYASGSVAYRAELSVQAERARVLGGVTVLGAVTGAFLVTRTSPTTFSAIVPWLIIVAFGVAVALRMLLQPSSTGAAPPARPRTMCPCWIRLSLRAPSSSSWKASSSSTGRS